jgi:hypothetical protein
MVAQGEAEASQVVPLGPGAPRANSAGAATPAGKPPERAGGGLVVPLGQPMVIAFLSAARQGGGAPQCWAVGADVVGTAVDRYLAAGLDPMDWWPMRAGSQRVPSTGLALAMRATRDMSVRPMVSAALLPSRGRSEERPSPA